MADLDEELEGILGAINEGKANFSEDEQNIIDGWIGKLSEPKETDEEKGVRNDYARALAKIVTSAAPLAPPFTDMPPEGDLAPFSDSGSKLKKFSFQIKKMPCPRPKSRQSTGAISKPKRVDRSPSPTDFYFMNEFEDVEEMVKAVARSKGQSFPEFVAAISRHTSDFGQELRTAMKSETSSFRDFVDRILSQRIKDLTEVLDEEQNRELQKIKRDIERWQLELSHVKRRIKEMIPNFDLDTYRKDKFYLKKLFTIDSGGLPEDDSFKRFKEESCHRLKWIADKTYKITRCNEQAAQEITDIKAETVDMEMREATKHQNLIKQINCNISEFQKLKSERDCLHRENAEIMSKFREMDDCQ